MAEQNKQAAEAGKNPWPWVAVGLVVVVAVIIICIVIIVDNIKSTTATNSGNGGGQGDGDGGGEGGGGENVNIDTTPVNPYTDRGGIQYQNFEQTGNGNCGYVNIKASNGAYKDWELFMTDDGSCYVGDPTQTGTGNINGGWEEHNVNFSDNDVSPDEHVFKITTTDDGKSWSFQNTAHPKISFVYGEAIYVKYEITRVSETDLWSIKKYNGDTYLTVLYQTQSSYAGGAYDKQYGYYGLYEPLEEATGAPTRTINEQQKFSFNYIGTPGPG